MLSAICFSLDQSKILSSNNGKNKNNFIDENSDNMHYKQFIKVYSFFQKSKFSTFFTRKKKNCTKTRKLLQYQYSVGSDTIKLFCQTCSFSYIYALSVFKGRQLFCIPSKHSSFWACFSVSTLNMFYPVLLNPEFKLARGRRP